MVACLIVVIVVVVVGRDGGSQGRLDCRTLQRRASSAEPRLDLRLRQAHRPSIYDLLPELLLHQQPRVLVPDPPLPAGSLVEALLEERRLVLSEALHRLLAQRLSRPAGRGQRGRRALKSHSHRRLRRRLGPAAAKAGAGAGASAAGGAGTAAFVALVGAPASRASRLRLAWACGLHAPRLRPCCTSFCPDFDCRWLASAFGELP